MTESSLSSVLGQASNISSLRQNNVAKAVSSVVPFRTVLNEMGNRLYIDFGGKPVDWIYQSSDVEIGITEDKNISYISVEFKKELSDEDLKNLRLAVNYEKA